ncbi:hypothetical protein KQX54_021053 [Cotesia glomerata]|uniref:Uncharacterized protein n=1 Tax=Cotesia glomerata TaxID=32391 RepID=A0AAV7J6K9_COTGL|nr:hypothetical protein KQX54_021053 [Cotesia glomerata]
MNVERVLFHCNLITLSSLDVTLRRREFSFARHSSLDSVQVLYNHTPWLNRHPIPLCKSFLATDSKVCKRRNGSTSLKQEGDADADGERRNKRLDGRKRREVVLGKESKIKWYSQLVLIPRAFDQQACLVRTFLLYYCSTVDGVSNALGVNENSPIQQWI